MCCGPHKGEKHFEGQYCPVRFKVTARVQANAVYVCLCSGFVGAAGQAEAFVR